jgi:hypothetical protein
MFRVQNKAKQDVSLGISLAVVLAKGDLLVAQSLDQNKIHNPPPAPFAGTSMEPVTEWVHKLKQEQEGKVKA